MYQAIDKETNTKDSLDSACTNCELKTLWHYNDRGHKVNSHAMELVVDSVTCQVAEELWYS